MTRERSCGACLRTHRYLYAQRREGRKMHLVEDFGDGRVGVVALCGRTPDSRGHWRMTCNLPLAHACRACCRIYDAIR